METPTLYIFVNDYVSTTTHPEPITNSIEAVLSSNFDYEMLFDGTKRVYFDAGIRMNCVEILYRFAVEFNGTNMEWTDVFSAEFLEPLVDETMQNCCQGYYDYCDKNNISCDYLDIAPSQIESFTHNIINQYLEYRSQGDLENAYLINNVGLEFESGTDTILLINCSFAILDQILFENKAFDNARNRNTLSDHIPLPRYLTIRNNCLLIEVDDVSLNFLDTIYLMLLFDAALQMLVGDKSDILKAALETKGYNNKKVRLYLKTATKQFAELHKMLDNSGARVSNLENLPDWNSQFH